MFSNEVQDLPADAMPGEPVEVRDFTGNFLGRGYMNPRSLIAVRILTRKQEDMDTAFFTGRIGRARDLRKDLGFGESFRAVFSEGDGLPGLIVDKYADTLVVQSLTAGIDGMLELVLAALREVYDPKTIVLKNETASRALEGLQQEKRVVLGETTGLVEFEESGIRYRADVLECCIDGDHSYEATKADIITGMNLGARIITVHDYAGGQPGVVQAGEEMLKDWNKIILPERADTGDYAAAIFHRPS